LTKSSVSRIIQAIWDAFALVGELAWEELRDVKLSKGNSWQSSHTLADMHSVAANIILKVEGAVIVIADVYDRPIALIYQNICHYWRGKSLDDDWERDSLSRRPREAIRSAAPGAAAPPLPEGITPPE
jgi:hypothetical protein